MHEDIYKCPNDSDLSFVAGPHLLLCCLLLRRVRLPLCFHLLLCVDLLLVLSSFSVLAVRFL